MSEIKLAITIYTRQECSGSDATIAEFMTAHIPFSAIDIDENKEALQYLKETTRNVTTPTVIAECSCKHHREMWSSHIPSRNESLFAMVRHLEASRDS